MVSPGFDFADFEMAPDNEIEARYPAVGQRARLQRS
jgi:predicted cupin superfamily sugar epimerase